MTYKIKIITGFREDQFYSIDANEAHKAYYLFLHPEERGVFSNGVAIIGKNIQGIEPDYNGTMNWNPSHTLQNEDWAELRSKGIDAKLKEIISMAKDASYLADQNPRILNKPLSEIQEVKKEAIETGTHSMAELLQNK